MKKKNNTQKLKTYLSALSLLLLAAIELLYHLKIPFQRDDLWYATNLVTGAPVSGFADILQSQLWHYFNWGGRSITHTILQTVIRLGEPFAAVCNVAVTVLLAFVMAKTATSDRDQKVTSSDFISVFAGAFALIFAMISDLFLTLGWESGCVNYVYSTLWILTFLLVYLRSIQYPDAAPLKGCAFWMVPLGLITGWSNENMGPAAFCISALILLYRRRICRKPIPVWMYLGSATSLLGSILMIVAPGNFVRNQFTENQSFWRSVLVRLSSLLRGACDYLLPSVLIFLLLTIMNYLLLRKLPGLTELFLTGMAMLAFGALFLSPTFPSRTAFGIMILLQTVNLSLIVRSCKACGKMRPYFTVAYTALWIYDIFICLMSALWYGGIQ